MYLLATLEYTLLTPEGYDSIKTGETDIIWYTMDGYECEKEINIRKDHSKMHMSIFQVTTFRQRTPHLVSFLITDGHEWSIPYVGMKPVRHIEDELVEDEILSVQRINAEEAYFYDGIPIGAVVNGYLAYPVHTPDNKMIDPISKMVLL